MDPILILQNSINTLGVVRPAVADADSITVPIIRVRNDLIKLLLHLQHEAEKDTENQDEEEI